MAVQSIGVLETQGFIALLEAADAMLKAANVEVVKYVPVGGGILTCVLRGELSGVKTALEAGAAAAQKSGGLRCYFVLANPTEAVSKLLTSE